MRTRVLIAGGLAAAIAAAVVLMFTLWGGQGEQSVTVPPILPTATASAQPSVIPRGFLQFESRTASPLGQDGFSWTQTDDPALPPLMSPCGGPMPSAGDTVAVRQIALVGPTLWKAERLYVYGSDSSAIAAIDEIEEALGRCSRHEEADGTAMVWRWQPVQIGDEAFFVTGQRFRGDGGVPGNYRGVVMRQGKAVVMYVDFGQRTALASLDDVPSHLKDAQAMSAKLHNKIP